ncbi:MAG: fibronectin type III domain-containing protein [Bryobacteraceae bacterium]
MAANFVLSATANIAANAATATTAQLTAPANKTSNNFAAGTISDDTNPLPSSNLTANQYTEIEWCIASGVNATGGQTYTLRVTNNGTALDTYAANATWLVGASATLSQTLADVSPTIAGTVSISGDVAQTIANVTPTITGTVAVIGDVSQTLAATTLVAEGTTSLSADVSQTLADTAITATGTVTGASEVSAEVAQTLEAVSATITGTVGVVAEVAQTVEAATLSATATAAFGSVNATVTQTLADVSLLAMGGSAFFYMSPSSYISANAVTPTTAQLNPPLAKTANGYFQAGWISDDINPGASANLLTDRYTEIEYSIVSSNGLPEGLTFSFRVTDNGTPLNFYTATPTLVSQNPISATLSQTVADVSVSATGTVETDAGRFAEVAQTIEAVTISADGTTGHSADVTVTLQDVNTTILEWSFTLVSGNEPTEYHLYMGRVSGIYTELIVVPGGTTTSAYVRDVAPDTGEWYCVIRAANAGGESDASAEVFFVVPTITATVENTTGIADVTQTLAAATLLSVGRVDVTATATPTLESVTPTITTTVDVAATATQTLGATTITSTTTIGVAADVTQTLGDASLIATGTVAWSESNADVSQTLEDVSLTADATVTGSGPNFAWVDALLDDAIASVDTTVLVSANVSQTLEACDLASSTHAGILVIRNINTFYDGSEVRC